MVGLVSGQSFIETVRKIADEVAAREGCSVYDLEFVGLGPSRALRVYIDKEVEGGASIEDCSKISRGLSFSLDAEENLIPGGEYNLEVSTPGLERALKEPRHYEKALGRTISVKASAQLTEFNPQVPELGLAKQVSGKLLSFDGRGLRVELALKESREEVFVPFESVTKANIVFEFVDAQKPQGKLQGKPGGKGAKNPHKGKSKTKS